MSEMKITDPIKESVATDIFVQKLKQRTSDLAAEQFNTLLSYMVGLGQKYLNLDLDVCFNLIMATISDGVEITRPEDSEQARAHPDCKFWAITSNHDAFEFYKKHCDGEIYIVTYNKVPIFVIGEHGRNTIVTRNYKQILRFDEIQLSKNVVRVNNLKYETF